jgi:hypothetical protein
MRCEPVVLGLPPGEVGKPAFCAQPFDVRGER